MKETRGTPKREEQKIIAGQKTYLLGKSPLRCYYYAKQDRARWSTADRAVQGMRWNAYMIRGRSTPFFSPMEPERLPPAAQKMKEVHVERERIWTAKERKAENHAVAGRNKERRNCREHPVSRERANEEIITCASVIPVSVHPKFRHLRLVSGKIGEPAHVISIRRVEVQNTATSSRKVPAQSSLAARGTDAEQLPLFSIQVSEGAAFFAEREESRAEIPATVKFVRPDFKDIKVPEAGAPEARKTKYDDSENPIVRIDMRMPENDNARPWGFDDERSLPSHGAVPVSVTAASDVPCKSGRVGYISSVRKKIAQLKLASGAASVPQ